MDSTITESRIDPKMLSSMKGCAQEAIKLLKVGPRSSDPKALVEAIDAFVYRWQKGLRPPQDDLDPEDAPFIFGSLWGDQLVMRFGWEWAMITFPDGSRAPAVVSEDRALAVYPIQFLIGCFNDPGVDATIALSFNMLAAGTIDRLKPRGYFNLMEGVHRIVPRD